MILVGQYDSPYVRRVAISLHLLELPFTRNPISVFGDADAMREINPLGRIPSLVLEDGEVLIDSAAILDYLDEQVGPARALLPVSGEPRRHALQIIAIATGAIDKAGAIAYERMLRPLDKQHAPWLERCAVQLASALAAL
ncbi:MAG: glutathione S-transferase family protein, partial [Myxococcales bacterium]|nr:glutathione S-transferase family protein [Myxococcales bacterium]